MPIQTFERFECKLVMSLRNSPHEAEHDFRQKLTRVTQMAKPLTACRQLLLQIVLYLVVCTGRFGEVRNSSSNAKIRTHSRVGACFLAVLGRMGSPELAKVTHFTKPPLPEHEAKHGFRQRLTRVTLMARVVLFIHATVVNFFLKSCCVSSAGELGLLNRASIIHFLSSQGISK